MAEEATTLTPRQQRQERRRKIRERREQRRQKQAEAVKANVVNAGKTAMAGGAAPKGKPLQPTSSTPTSTPTTPFVDRDKNPLYINNLYYNQAAFLVLAGPSLADLNLDLLRQRGIWTIGVNQSPSVFPTNAHTFVDTPRKFHAGIWLDPTILKIIPERMFGRQLMWKVDDSGTPGKFSTLTHRMAGLPHANQSPSPAVLCKQLPGVIGYKRNADFDPEKWLDEPTVNWGNSKKSARKNKTPHTLNVMFAVTKICYALGFRRLYLLGCDFYMQESKPYAFDQSKNVGGCASNNNAYRNLNEMFGLLRPRFEAAGFEVFNCNAQSGFRVFPFRAFADAVEDARCRMPREPWDVTGWYDSTPAG